MPEVWPEITLVTGIFAVGNILFGHFEERMPKWRKILKLFLFVGLVALVSATAGRPWSFLFIGALLVPALVAHLWWLPKHGINGWTGEPKEKYYALRGWKREDGG